MASRVDVGPDYAQNIPPVLLPTLAKRSPPQITISLPVQTKLWPARTIGALVVLVAVQ
jgi:hypothetical protein